MADLDKLHQLCEKTYKQQAVWFLNSFWETVEADAEQIWLYVVQCNELDLEKHGDGNGLDEMKAHVFLEKFKETLTVRELREKLRSTGAIGESERPKLVPLTHYLLFKYNVNWHTLVDETRQGSNKEELDKAEQMLAEVQALFQESERAASAARIAHNEAQSAETLAKARAEEAKASAAEAKTKETKAIADAKVSVEREAESRAAQSELQAALAEVQAQEKAYNDKKADLEKKSQEGGVVSRNKAANELAQLLSEDPLPLRRAKITAEAALKKAEKATEAASSARIAAEQSATSSSQAREAAERDAKSAEQAAQAATSAAQAAAQAAQAAEAALQSAIVRLNEAEAYLAEVKSKPGQSFGALFWIDRELHEQKKYMPVSKGGIAK